MNLRYVKFVLVYVFLDFDENIKEVFNFVFKVRNVKG